ncbi:ornithine cyclodeaminase family protein [Phytohabitans kaempferiae]|uniref:Ornithine cyclodeaminase family protein n=1 Tax=Phytohabitans kaempferiae TaxID=1620943 RepID=A0ABV6M776_9ACTN
MNILTLGADEVLCALGADAAIDAILAALRGGLTPADDPPRARVPLAHGLLLMMPAQVGADAGVKVIGLAPGNPAQGMPVIQGTYLHLDARTFAPVALLDGAALTALRTPAVTLAAVRDRLRTGSAPHRVIVFGTGVQARAHLRALRSVVGCGERIETAWVVSRRGGDPVEGAARLTAGSHAAAAALREATIVVCATDAREPLFDSTDLAADAVVIAVGSHERDARELPSDAFRGASVVVEDRATALREAGDIVMAVHDGALAPDELTELVHIARGSAAVPAEGRVIVKTSGMSWEDVVIARAILERRGRTG